jgi:hypothetical protein
MTLGSAPRRQTGLYRVAGELAQGVGGNPARGSRALCLDAPGQRRWRPGSARGCACRCCAAPSSRPFSRSCARRLQRHRSAPARGRRRRCRLNCRAPPAWPAGKTRPGARKASGRAAHCATLSQARGEARKALPQTWSQPSQDSKPCAHASICRDVRRAGSATMPATIRASGMPVAQSCTARSWSRPRVLAIRRMAGMDRPRRRSPTMPKRAMPASSPGRACACSKARAVARRSGKGRQIDGVARHSGVGDWGSANPARRNIPWRAALFCSGFP